jgi:hypothetical protein
MKTFDLWTKPLGGGAWGAGTNMWHLETPASYKIASCPSGHTDSHTLYTYIWGEGAWGGSDIRSMSSIRPICKCRCPPLPDRQPLLELVQPGADMCRQGIHHHKWERPQPEDVADLWKKTWIRKSRGTVPLNTLWEFSRNTKLHEKLNLQEYFCQSDQGLLQLLRHKIVKKIRFFTYQLNLAPAPASVSHHSDYKSLA